MAIELYDAWEVRVPVDDSLTFNEARRNVEQHMAAMGGSVTFRRGKGRRARSKRFHFWEASDYQSAVALYFTFGDQLRKQKYPLKEGQP